MHQAQPHYIPPPSGQPASAQQECLPTRYTAPQYQYQHRPLPPHQYQHPPLPPQQQYGSSYLTGSGGSSHFAVQDESHGTPTLQAPTNPATYQYRTDEAATKIQQEVFARQNVACSAETTAHVPGHREVYLSTTLSSETPSRQLKPLPKLPRLYRCSRISVTDLPGVATTNQPATDPDVMATTSVDGADGTSWDIRWPESVFEWKPPQVSSQHNVRDLELEHIYGRGKHQKRTHHCRVANIAYRRGGNHQT